MVHASPWRSSNVILETGLGAVIPTRYGGAERHSTPRTLPMTPDSLRVDETDRQILAALLDDGRATFEQLGQQVSLSAPAVKRRVDRLREGAVITGFKAVVDHAA